VDENIGRMYLQPECRKTLNYLVEAPQKFVKTNTVPQCIDTLLHKHRNAKINNCTKHTIYKKRKIQANESITLLKMTDVTIKNI